MLIKMSKDEKEIALNKKMEEMRKKNEELVRRYQVRLFYYFSIPNDFLFIVLMFLYACLCRKLRPIRKMRRISVEKL